MAINRTLIARMAGIVWAICFAAIAWVSAEDRLPFEEPKDPSKLPRRAAIETTKGTFEIMFFRDEAPISVRNFEFLAKTGTYDYVKFHKYMDRYAIQGGDPTGTGRGGPGYTLPPEFSRVKHIRGTLGWARPSMKVNPERRSSGSQFYILLTDAFHLDGFYTAFARVVNGMEVVDSLRVGDRILSVTFPDEDRRNGGVKGAREKGAAEVNALIRERASGAAAGGRTPIPGAEPTAPLLGGPPPPSLGRSPEEDVDDQMRRDAR